jgi:hypothetical protein
VSRFPYSFSITARSRTAIAVLTIVVGFAAGTLFLPAQSSSPAQTKPPEPPTAPASNPEQPDSSEPTPSGKILFSREATSTAEPAQAPADKPNAPEPAKTDPLAVTESERSAPTFTAYDLDVHLAPATAAISVRAGLTVRNDGAAPLRRLVLQITSSMHWDAFSIQGAPLSFLSRPIDTDADHTGQTQEAVVSLPRPLPPGESTSITALYSGVIKPSATRLERIGAPAEKALAADWDAIATDGTALRGFGSVLWYPVASPPIFLGDGAKLFQAVGATKLRQASATARLRLAIEYLGDPPDTAFFCGRRQKLTAISDNRDVPIAESPGVATADFAPKVLGFRTPDLFITGHPSTQVGTNANPDLISAVTDHPERLAPYSAAATLVEPLLTDWFGARPQTPLTIVDHTGEPYEDGPLLLRPLSAGDSTKLASTLAHSLTHAWIHSNHAWIDEGLAEFMNLLWTERSNNRAVALATLDEATRPLALAEPEVPSDSKSPDIPNSSSSTIESSSSNSSDFSAGAAPSVSPAGASLAAATGEIFYRTKAAAVWWMLRGIVGDDTMKQALQAYRTDPRLDADPEGLQHTLEKVSHKDLRWFFNDWVYRDRGLPDLTIVDVTPRQLEARSGLPSGWLIAVEVHNDGYAVADVPITVRSATDRQTTRLRIPGRSSATTRMVFAGTPEQVEVNDGSVPETRTSVHTRQLVLPNH